MIEIERKFLIVSEVFKSKSNIKYTIKQGYLNTDKKRTVRVRIKGNKGFITVKGESSQNGLSRFEWEQQISKSDATLLLSLCENTIIEKTRYEVSVGKHIFEIDEFIAANKGLIIAEVELKHETETFEKPSWLGKEVTGDAKYYNSQLAIHPYGLWPST